MNKISVKIDSFIFLLLFWAQLILAGLVHYGQDLFEMDVSAFILLFFNFVIASILPYYLLKYDGFTKEKMINSGISACIGIISAELLLFFLWFVEAGGPESGSDLFLGVLFMLLIGGITLIAFTIPYILNIFIIKFYSNFVNGKRKSHKQ